MGTEHKDIRRRRIREESASSRARHALPARPPKRPVMRLRKPPSANGLRLRKPPSGKGLRQLRRASSSIRRTRRPRRRRRSLPHRRRRAAGLGKPEYQPGLYRGAPRGLDGHTEKRAVQFPNGRTDFDAQPSRCTSVTSPRCCYRALERLGCTRRHGRYQEGTGRGHTGCAVRAAPCSDSLCAGQGAASAYV
jgi:hypothetical protein